MARGGPRNVSPRTPPGGPGRFSRRTDGQQIATPPLSGSPDIQSGDIGQLRAAQRIAPLPAGTPEPRPAGTAPRQPTGARVTQGGIPSHLLEMANENPDEPTTTGLDVGPGAGSEVLQASTPAPDIRENALEALWLYYGNEDAGRLLGQLRDEKLQGLAQTPQAPQPEIEEDVPLPPGETETPSSLG